MKQSTIRTQAQKTFLLISFVFECLLRLAIYIASAIQLIFLCSKYARFCAHDNSTLNMEYNWMLSLAIAQIIFTTVHIVWKFFIIRAES